MNERLAWYTKMLIAVGIILFLLGYFIVTEYNKYESKKLQLSYAKGAEEAVLTITNIAGQCQQVPITLPKQNITITLVSLECVQKAIANNK